MKTEAVYVFLGPSCPLEIAREILPKAHFCPPIQTGDLVAVLQRREPIRAICIIDGFFESVGAVWHKEILHALSLGVEVYGASSMGALRACELEPFGMIGVGKVFESFKNGILNDDDEVTVSHLPEGMNFKPVSDAMVNIRATLAQALNEKIISNETSALILNDCKSSFYKERNLKSTLERLIDEVQSLEIKKDLKNLLEWLPTGFVDQKRLDAIELMKRLADRSEATRVKKIERPSANYPIQNFILASLNHSVSMRPFPFQASWLKQSERLESMMRLTDQKYRLLRDAALLLNYTWNWAYQNPNFFSSKSVSETLKRLEKEISKTTKNFHSQRLEYISFFSLRYSGGLEKPLLHFIASLWSISEFILAQERVASQEIDPVLLQNLADQFIHEQEGVVDELSLNAWLKKNALTNDTRYERLIVFLHRTQSFIHPQAARYFGVAYDQSGHNWFSEACILSKSLRPLKDLPQLIEKNWGSDLNQTRDERAYRCDFRGGYSDILKLQRQGLGKKS